MKQYLSLLLSLFFIPSSLFAQGFTPSETRIGGSTLLQGTVAATPEGHYVAWTQTSQQTRTQATYFFAIDSITGDITPSDAKGWKIDSMAANINWGEDQVGAFATGLDAQGRIYAGRPLGDTAYVTMFQTPGVASRRSAFASKNASG